MSGFDYDFFVIGAGSGGVRAARTAAALGARTAIAEQRFYGGTCVNVGCIPKKLYTYAAHARQEFADSQAYGWQLPAEPRFDWARLKANKDIEINRLNGIYENLLKTAGVDIYQGNAVIQAPNTVRVGEQRFTAEHIVIAVGGQPFMPDIPGIEHAMNSDDFFELSTQPESVFIVGGGYIATELAGIFAGLGTQVTLAHRGNLLLNGFDEDIREFFTDAARGQYRLLLNTEAAAIEKQQTGYRVQCTDGSSHQVDAVLFATGRQPMTDSLGLAELGIQLSERGSIVVNDEFETACKGVYAVGDVISRLNLTPVALAEGQALARRLFGQASAVLDYDLVPAAVFCDPPVASVGMTEAKARQHYPRLDIYKSSFRPLRHTLTGRDSKTLMKMVVDRDSDRVLGLHMAGADAAEIMQGFAVALQMGATKAQLDATLGIHPTSAEEFVTMRTPQPQPQPQ